jgi:hypothetical protein
MSRPELRTIPGGGDIVLALEYLLEEARAGRVDALGVLLLVNDHEHGLSVAAGPRAGQLWARMVAAAADMTYTLMQGDGLERLQD